MSGLETADHVSVHLSGCGTADAGVVFGALEAAFPGGTEPDASRSAAGQRTGEGAATMWCTVVDARTRTPRGAPSAAPLTGAVVADLFGAADPVRQVEEELAAVFDVEHQGTVPGEHELEVRLRLAPRPGA
ncbi:MULTISPECIES: hypothetical protein [Streptomyces]|uniref:Uncharacterized protein n=1 Tax=Streptomyces luteosporeus TaxID=173856 RepID=A0ABN3TT76_9ACTN